MFGYVSVLLGAEKGILYCRYALFVILYRRCTLFVIIYCRCVFFVILYR